MRVCGLLPSPADGPILTRNEVRSAVRVRSSALRNKIFGRKPPANLHSLDLLAKLLFAEDSYIEALHLYERALVIRKKEAQESNAHD